MLSQQQGELEWQRGRRPRGPACDVAMSPHKAALTGRVDKTQALELKKINKKITYPRKQGLLSIPDWTCTKPKE